tara:strand:- start:548 stop:760 length:213 start_codon:yes stop_codon:yes gene_type:complete
MIDIYREVVEIFDEKIENTTKYNGQVYKLTELNEQGGHGDIIKYLEENKLDTEQLQEVLLAFVKALRGHI